MMRHRTWMTIAGVSLFALLAAACSDVEEPAAGGAGAPVDTAVAQCADDTIVLAVNPWIGAKANAAVAKVLMEQQMGCTVELEDPIAE